MLGLASIFSAILLASAIPFTSVGVLEPELTALLQEYLTPLDPATIDALTDLHIVTDHSDLLFSGTDVVVSGFSNIVVTLFEPPIPLISKAVRLDTVIDVLSIHTDNYELTGTFNGADSLNSGKADLTLNEFGVNIFFRADSYSVEPLSLCIEQGSLTVELTVTSIISELEGADDINADIDANGPALLELVDKLLEENSDLLEEVLNNALCSAGRM
ncbi:hypothetical protein OTU49_008622 [Cherax quadricarinatus]|uniref:Uncharacterized protein n=1 Tax=Cherax quadricarinatus TaxID=27406 RepID=A0AAW0WBL2_CHEQU|nr:uncharacterized protein LOC128697844 [Cherax quadricarinatus]